MSPEILNKIFKAIKDPSLDEMELTINNKVYALQPVEKEPEEGEPGENEEEGEEGEPGENEEENCKPSEPRVWKTADDDGFVAIRSIRSLLVAFFDPK